MSSMHADAAACLADVREEGALEDWQASASVLQVGELWMALEHFNMSHNLGHRIVRGRRSDAIALLSTLAKSVRMLLLSTTYFTPRAQGVSSKLHNLAVASAVLCDMLRFVTVDGDFQVAEATPLLRGLGAFCARSGSS
jgi:hypothetical protein